MVYQRKKRTYEQQEQLPINTPQNNLFASPDLETDETDNAFSVDSSQPAPTLEMRWQQASKKPFYSLSSLVSPPSSAVQRRPVSPLMQATPTDNYWQRVIARHDTPGLMPQTGKPAVQRDVMADEAAVQKAPEGGADSAKGIEPLVQAKLTVGPAGDRYEQEADHVAAQVVDTINHPHGQPTVQRDRDGDDADRQSRINIWPPRLKTGHTPMQPTLQRVGEAGGGVSDETASQIAQAKGGGQRLDEGLQRSMSQAMGADFSGVRIHTDAQANQLNQTIQAKAFTTGQDVFFKRGAYDPNSKGGQELIAHELTHVVQQGGAAIQGNSVVQRRTDEVIQRDDDDDWDDDVHPAMKAGVAEGTKNLENQEQLYESVNQQLGQPDNSPDLYDDYNFHKNVRSVNQSIGPVNVMGDASPVIPPTPATKTHTYKTNWHRQYENQDQDKTQGFQTHHQSLNSDKQPKQKFDHRTFIASRKERENYYSSEAANTATKVAEAMKLDELKAYLQHIPLKELSAINEYQGMSYQSMNENLRSGSGKAQKVKLAASGLNRLPPVVGNVYRGVKFSFASCEQYGYLNVGGIKTEKAFMSTTIDKRYWLEGSKFGNGKTAFQIESKGGAKDLRAIAGSGVEGEDELIFTPGTQFKVQGVTPRSEVITSSNVGDIPSRPTVTQPVSAKDLETQNKAAVVMYLQEIPSKEQAGMYEELGKKYGTVNINKATEMSKQMQAIENNMYKRENFSELDSLSEKTQENFHVHVLSAIKQISQNLDLSDAVINKLKSGSVSGLKEFTQTNPSVKALLSRWKIHMDMVNEHIACLKENRQQKEEQKRQQKEQEEKAAYAKILSFLNNDMSMAQDLINTLEQKGYGSKKGGKMFVRKFIKEKYNIKLKTGNVSAIWTAIKQLKGWS